MDRPTSEAPRTTLTSTTIQGGGNSTTETKLETMTGMMEVASVLTQLTSTLTTITPVKNSFSTMTARAHG